VKAADAVVLLRTFMIFLVAYLILARFNPIATIVLILVALALDAVDGYFAKYGRVNLDTLRLYIRHQPPKNPIKPTPYGARLDIAGDRVVEYTMWIVFTFVGIVPLFILLLIVLRHSFADAMMGARGTSSKMKTKFAQVVYASNMGRGAINVLKAVTYCYLVLVYVSGYPLLIGYALVAALFAYIMLRGAAEIYDSIKSY
jgi:phosphatidylglycerophosphate synthase